VSPTAAAEAAAAVGDISCSSSNSTAAGTAAAVLVPYTPLLNYAKSVLALSSEHIAVYSSSSDQAASMQQEPLLSAVLPSLTAALVVLPLSRRVKGLLSTQLLPQLQALVRSCDSLLPLTATADSGATSSSDIAQSIAVDTVLTADVSGVWHLHSDAADSIPAQGYTLQLQRQDSSSSSSCTTTSLSNCYELQGTGEGDIADVAVHGAVSGLHIKFLEVWTEGGTCEVDARLSPEGSFLSGSFLDTYTGTRGSITGYRTEVHSEFAHSAAAQLSSLQVLLATLAGKLATCLITGVELRYAESAEAAFISRDDTAGATSNAAASATASASGTSPARSVSPPPPTAAAATAGATAATADTTAGAESSAAASTTAATAGLTALLTLSSSEDEDEEDSEDSEADISDNSAAEQRVEAVDAVPAVAAAVPAAAAVTTAATVAAAIAPTTAAGAAAASSAGEAQLAVRYATATRLFAGGMWWADAAPHVAATLEYCLPESSRTAEQRAWVAAVFAQPPQTSTLSEQDSAFYTALRQGAATATATPPAVASTSEPAVAAAAVAIDEWVQKTAGASPIMKLGGAPMAAARRAAVSALLLHTGLLPRLLLEWERASSGSSGNAAAAADASSTTAATTATVKPCEPIVQIWRAARQVSLSTFIVLLHCST
jgi:hypothetical protein